jgi:hypothetical protein
MGMSLAQKELHEKRLRAAAELEQKRKQSKIELELKRGKAKIDIATFNTAVAEIQSRIDEIDSVSIACVFKNSRKD